MIILTILKSISFFSVLYKKQLSIFFLNIIMLKQTIQRFINKIQPERAYIYNTQIDQLGSISRQSYFRSAET